MAKVAIAKGNAYEATLKALEMVEFNKLVKRKKKILIKPNLVVPVHSNFGITSDVNVVRAILDFLPKNKAVIADGSDGAKKTFKINGYDKLAKEYEIPLIDLNEENEWVEVEVKNPIVLKKITIAKRVLESDFLISVGKLKIHSIAKFTGSLKNMMGFCPKEQRLKIHSLIPYSLIDLLSVKNPDFGVIDGIVGNEIDENIPHPVKMNLVIAGRDCFALDSVASEVIGINVNNVPYLQIYKRRMGADLNIKVVGEKIERVKRDFRRGSFNLRGDGQRIVIRFFIMIGRFNFFYKHIFPWINKLEKRKLKKLESLNIKK